MKYTSYFKNLPLSLQKDITAYSTGNISNLQRIKTENNRSVIYELAGHNVILKVMLDKGRNDYDIDALIDLEDIDYFPKLYAYKEREYLFMEKARGMSLPEFIESGATDQELKIVLTSLLKALDTMLDRNRIDWDLKLEHFYWDKENEHLTWIDLGLCEKSMPLYPSKEENIINFKNFFENELSYYNIEI
ncbi:MULTISPECIES: hypothetical protein [unclassified Planococcus (in: firmicutes)]|uniref:hypothetical protein n=1 Tax=unclassified Planococcus (in: firmicutes) TaxID=2662419 RepID=UPI000C7E7CF5|nr:MULTISPECIES: hypothetical protein [unclassified Planococcus (in: firmicutes)]PKG46528.1 hypothetical protein CXF66_06535 [Planococcus sp. Urea-trap-24]PKG89786.1 hypothetical protein CXF91_06270 [Planococcus sp. Urea-3u-39]PKH40811.1 hypothetical protein CXF77_07125 [Planococcus sp. MB-3u-09]